jgi:hypothetical protein
MSPAIGASWRRRWHRPAALRVVGLAALAALCGGALPVAAQPAGSSPQQYPDVVAVNVRSAGPGRFDFDVTVSSPYDTPRRYADGFRVSGRDGTVYGERKLWHDHADEQPFTRDLYGVAVPPGVRVLVVQARDSRFGYGGRTMEVVLPGRN